MSALFNDATRALARVVTPDTRVVIVLAAEAGESEDAPITLRMSVLEDCGMDAAELAALLVKACDMALDPSARREDAGAAVM